MKFSLWIEKRAAALSFFLSVGALHLRATPIGHAHFSSRSNFSFDFFPPKNATEVCPLPAECRIPPHRGTIFVSASRAGREGSRWVGAGRGWPCGVVLVLSTLGWHCPFDPHSEMDRVKFRYPAVDFFFSIAKLRRWQFGRFGRPRPSIALQWPGVVLRGFELCKYPDRQLFFFYFEIKNGSEVRAMFSSKFPTVESF